MRLRDQRRLSQFATTNRVPRNWSASAWYAAAALGRDVLTNSALPIAARGAFLPAAPEATFDRSKPSRSNPLSKLVGRDDGVRREVLGSGRVLWLISSIAAGCTAGNGLVVSAYQCVDAADRSRKNAPRPTSHYVRLPPGACGAVEINEHQRRY